MQSDILGEIYDRQGIDDINYYPSFLSQNFGVAIGHVGIMAAHLAAFKVEIVPFGQRKI